MKLSTLSLLVGLMMTSRAAQAAPLTCAEAANPKIVVQRCFAGDLKNGHYIGDAGCFPFSKPQTLKGIWHVELEGSFFVPFGTDPKSRGIWLEVANPPRLAEQSMRGDVQRDFAVELLGRRSLCRIGVFGRLGMTRREIVAEKFLSIRLKSDA